ncbi:hypothetical protein [Pseudarthrobacter sp. B4EP4b]|uniref:hypothetical protein n=1 Tax=Pseudarthrobacter sp. B4EP4b TaxID=2590664 RepID=UPI00114D8382|nr:hypothetical protein [Pseudarthrobacter sp. B4EP4b]
MVEDFRVEYESSGFVKLLRAAEHFHSLEAEVDYWNSNNRLLAPTRQNVSDPSELEIFIPDTPKIPTLRWSNRFGDGVHNLRSSLDVLAYEMCHLDGKTPENPKGVYFPIVEQEAKWLERTRHLGSIPQTLLDRIKQVQPWHVADPKRHVLTLINGLDNLNKHRSTADLFTLPAGLSPEKLRAWPEGKAAEDAWATPWMNVKYMGPVGSAAEPALWDIDAWPVVHFEGRMALLGHLQPWLYQETMRIFKYITSGEWPLPNNTVSEPSWIELPSSFEGQANG